jgi:outer membrane lipoprotein SlyB
MAGLVWVMMGIALWHFTIFLPDHFWSGIVGAFVGATLGAFLFGLLINGFTIPGQSDTSLLSAVEAIPGAVIGMAVAWWIGTRQEHAQPAH